MKRVHIVIDCLNSPGKIYAVFRDARRAQRHADKIGSERDTEAEIQSWSVIEGREWDMNNEAEMLRQRVIELENAVCVLADALTDMAYELGSLPPNDAIRVYNEFIRKKERNDAQN